MWSLPVTPVCLLFTFFSPRTNLSCSLSSFYFSFIYACFFYRLCQSMYIDCGAAPLTHAYAFPVMPLDDFALYHISDYTFTSCTFLSPNEVTPYYRLLSGVAQPSRFHTLCQGRLNGFSLKYDHLSCSFLHSLVSLKYISLFFPHGLRE